MGLSLGGESFTCVGNVAPPMPTTPASRTASRSFSGAASPPTGAMEGSHSSRPSFSRMTVATRRPPAMMHGWTPLTLPETGALHRSADKAIRRADLLPHIHALADLDDGLAGRAGVLQKRQPPATAGAGSASMGSAPVARFSPAPSRGCTPRRNVNVLPMLYPPIFRAQGAIWIFIYPYPAKFASKKPLTAPFSRLSPGASAREKHMVYHMQLYHNSRDLNHIIFNKNCGVDEFAQ